jgi:hypothetical protein
MIRLGALWLRPTPLLALAALLLASGVAAAVVLDGQLSREAEDGEALRTSVQARPPLLRVRRSEAARLGLTLPHDLELSREPVSRQHWSGVLGVVCDGCSEPGADEMAPYLARLELLERGEPCPAGDRRCWRVAEAEELEALRVMAPGGPSEEPQGGVYLVRDLVP